MALKFRFPGFGPFKNNPLTIGNFGFGRFGRTGRVDVPFPKSTPTLRKLGDAESARQGSGGVGAPRTPAELQAAAGVSGHSGPTKVHAPDKLLAEIQRNKTGFAMANRFRVTIPNFIPAIKAGYGSESASTESLNILCTRCSLPGKNMSTVEHVTYRQAQKLPNGYTVDEIEFEFLLTNNYSVLTFFQEWQKSMINTEDYLINYENFYMKDIEVFQMDTQDNDIFGMKLKEAYPISVQPIELSNDGEGIARLVVSMAFFDFETLNIGSTRPNPSTGIVNPLPTIDTGISNAGPFGASKSRNKPFSYNF